MFDVFNSDSYMNPSDGKVYACSMFSIVTEHQMYMKLLNGKIYSCSLFLIVTEHLYKALKWKDLCMFSVFNRKIYACSVFSILIEHLYNRQIQRFTRVQLLRANLMGLHLASSLATQSCQLLQEYLSVWVSRLSPCTHSDSAICQQFDCQRA